jgi:hypothetical protein
MAHTVRPHADGQFYVHAPSGRTIAGPYRHAEDADRQAHTLDRDRRLLIVVEKGERSSSAWDAYVKHFRHTGDGRSAEEQLLDWWLALPDRACTRTRAVVRVYDITDREWNLLAPGNAEGVLDPLAHEPADPTLALRLDPDAIRAHFADTADGQRARALPTSALAEAARQLLATSRVRQSLEELCTEVLERAAAATSRDREQ